MKFKRIWLALLAIMLWTNPAAATDGWFRTSIDGTGTVLTDPLDLQILKSGKQQTLYYYFSNTADSLWVTIGRGVRVRIHLNADTGSANANGTDVVIRILYHMTNAAPDLFDAGALLNLNMTSAEDQFYDLDGPVKLMVDPVNGPTLRSAYVSIIKNNAPSGD